MHNSPQKNSRRQAESIEEPDPLSPVSVANQLRSSAMTFARAIDVPMHLRAAKTNKEQRMICVKNVTCRSTRIHTFHHKQINPLSVVPQQTRCSMLVCTNMIQSLWLRGYPPAPLCSLQHRRFQISQIFDQAQAHSSARKSLSVINLPRFHSSNQPAGAATSFIFDYVDSP